MVELESWISRLVSNNIRPMAAGSLVAYLVLAILVVPLIIGNAVWLIDLSVAKFALIVLALRGVLDSSTMYKWMTRTMKPAVGHMLCPKCKVTMDTKEYQCPTCGWTFAPKH